MLEKKLIKLLIAIIGIISISALFYNVNAQTSSNISVSSNSVKVGDTITVTVSATNAASWKINLDATGPVAPTTDTSFSDVSQSGENENVTIGTVTYKATGEGEVNFKLSGQLVAIVNGEYKSFYNPDSNAKVQVSTDNSTQTNNANQEKDNVTKQTEQEKTAEQEKNVETEKKEETTSNKNETVPEVTVSESNKTMYAKEEVNVRSSYSTSSKIVGSLRQDEQITVTGITSNGWTRIKYNGQTAYVSSQFLTDTKPKEKSSNNYLKGLKIEEASLTPEFNKETTSYKANVGKDIVKLKIDASAEDDKSKVEISGNEELKEGENTVKIIVTAENGETKTYTITVTKEKKGKLQLSSLQIAGITLNETFKSDKYEYSANLQDNSDITKLEVKATANDKDATIEILGNDKLVIGENVITIMLKSKDGKENVTYQIIVNKKAYSDNVTNSNISNNNPNNDMFLYVAVGIFSIALILIIIIIVRSIKKSKEDEFDDEDLFRTDNNYTEELYSVRTENINEKPIEKNNEKLYKNEDSNKLYDVEKEVDFSDDEEKPKKRKGGKHSK